VGTKARTLRLPEDQAEMLEAVARVDNMSVNETIQKAIAEHIEARRKDAAFHKRLEASMQRNRKILELLAR
jgi:ribosomal protein S15P/S13E